MEHSLKIGFGFGLTSGIITTLGLMVGLYAGTNSKLAVVGGILVIAVADALSDAFGIHISEESENKHTTKQIWLATFSTFLAKFFFAITFIIPVLLFALSTAVIVAVVWGMILLSIFSFFIAKVGKKRAWKVILEHIVIALAVVFITYKLGSWVSFRFS